MKTTRFGCVRLLESLALAHFLSACAARESKSAKPPPAAQPSALAVSSAAKAAPLDEGPCSADHFCVVRGIPLQVTFSAIWGASPADIWIVGEGGALLHGNGASWTAVESGTKSALRAITGTSARDVWAAGLEGTLLHFDGSSWSKTQNNGAPWSFAAGPNERPIYALFARVPGQVWEGGSGARYFDGTTWSEVHHGSHLPISALWGAGASDVWAVGVQGTIQRWNGSAWAHVGREDGPNYAGVWGSAANDVWIVGSAGAILHWNGASWTPSASGTEADLNAVYGFGASDVLAVGDHGTILDFRGSAWASASSPTQKALLGLWGASERAVWAVGESGTVLHRGN